MRTSKSPIPATPVLAFVFNIFGGLLLLGAITVAVGAAMQFKSAAGGGLSTLPIIGSLVFTGIIYLGAAEVIQLIAHIAIEAARAADAFEHSSSAGGSQLYLYLVGEEVRGPVSLDVLRSLRSVTTGPRYVTGETLACRVGDSTWQRLAELMDKPA